jgi:integral membrane protein
LGGVQKLFSAYRVLAFVVGTLLVLLCLGMVMKYLFTDGSSIQSFGEDFTPIVAVGHGYLYMAYLVVAFLLARRERWSVPFTLVMLIAGLVPLLIFWVEHRVVQKVRTEAPAPA